MRYMRIPQNKFWGWVVFSAVFGLAIGLAIMFWRTSALSAQITTLTTQLHTGGSSSELASVQAQLASAESTIAALQAQNSQLQAQVSSGGGQGSPTTSSTTATPALVVVSRTISPSIVATSGTITMTAKVKGTPDRVTMRLYNASKSFDKTYTLVKGATSGGVQTWKLQTKAPATAGTYHYFATAIEGTQKVTMKGASPSVLTVH